MKKLLFFLILSNFCFAQNVELLKKASNADTEFISSYNNILYPGYIIADSYTEGQYKNYKLVPADTSSEDMKDCKLGNPCKMGVSVVYKQNNNDTFAFYSAKGDAKLLFDFWKKEISTNVDESNSVKVYKNDKENIWYNMQPTSNSWTIRNMNNR